MILRADIYLFITDTLKAKALQRGDSIHKKSIRFANEIARGGFGQGVSSGEFNKILGSTRI